MGRKMIFLIIFCISIILINCDKTNNTAEKFPIAGEDYTINYDAKSTNLTGDVSVVYVFDFWEPIYNCYSGPEKLFENVLSTKEDRASTIQMEKVNDQWQATIAIPKDKSLISWYFTDGENFDYNEKKTFVSYIYTQEGKPVKNARFRNVDFLEMAAASPKQITDEIRDEVRDYPSNWIAQIVCRRKIFEKLESFNELSQEMDQANIDYQDLVKTFGETDSLKQVLASWNYDYGRSIYRMASKTARKSFDKFEEIMATVPIEKQWGSMKENYAAIIEGNQLRDNNEKFMANLKGSTPPDFEFTTVDGKTKKLSDLKGNYTLLEFWSTGCGPCIGEIPNLKQNYETYHPKGFQILSICIDNLPKDKFLDFLMAKEAGDWMFVVEGEDNSISEMYYIYGVPTFILIDPDGVVINHEGEIRGDRLGEKLKELYQS